MKKRKLTSEERRRKRERKAAFEIVFINGKQKRVRRPPMIEGLPVDEFLARNADPLWLHQNGMWWLLPQEDDTVNEDARSEETHLLFVNSLFSEAAEMNETSWSLDENIRGQGTDDVPF